MMIIPIMLSKTVCTIISMNNKNLTSFDEISKLIIIILYSVS